MPMCRAVQDEEDKLSHVSLILSTNKALAALVISSKPDYVSLAYIRNI